MIRTSYALNKLLTAIARRHATRERLTDDDLAGHDLTEAERETVKTSGVALSNVSPI